MATYDLGTRLTNDETGLALPAINNFLGVTDAQIATELPPSVNNSILSTSATVSPAQLTTIRNQITAYRNSISSQSSGLTTRLNNVKTTFNGLQLSALTATQKQNLAYAVIVWFMAKQGWIADDGNTIQIP